jgi:hypothetical protein
MEIQVEAKLEELNRRMDDSRKQDEIYFRRLCKQDIDAALRGRSMDLVAQVDRKTSEIVQEEVSRRIQPYVEAQNRSQQRVHEMLQSDNERLTKEREEFRKSFEDQVAAVVLTILREYYVLDAITASSTIIRNP